MGQEIAQLARERGHHIMTVLDCPDDWIQAGDTLHNADIVIDFSLPETALENIRRAFDLKLPIVTGTTGWYDHLPQARKWCEAEGRALFVAPNFSIGVNLMLQLAEKLAGLLNRFPDYRVSIEEIHHVHKKDTPSGTAIRIAETVVENMVTLKGWSPGENPEQGLLPVISRRIGEETGTHSLSAESKTDRLEITHRAKNRKGFAEGALLAAEWVQGKQGFFTMKELLEFTE